jgi:4-oxalocrotonate tautomerase
MSEEHAFMPYIIIKALKGRDVDLKRRLAKRITEATVDVYGVPPEVVSIRFEEVDPESLAVGGVLKADGATGG